MCNSMGIDIGQKRSSSGICVAQTEWRESDGSFHFLIRRLERLPAGTPFPEIAGRVGEIAAGLVERGEDSHPTIYVNATGLGDPVVELIRDSADRSSMAISPVYFNYGDQRIEMNRGVVSLGKAYLVSRLQTLLQTRRIHLPRTEEGEQLARELLDYEIQVDEKANERYGAFRVGTQDDLITALGLAVQKEQVQMLYGSDELLDDTDW